MMTLKGISKWSGLECFFKSFFVLCGDAKIAMKGVKLITVQFLFELVRPKKTCRLLLSYGVLNGINGIIILYYS